MYLIQNYSRLPVRFVRGEGVYLYDDKGKRYLDLVAGIAVCSLGHSHPKLTEAICSQAKELIHVSNLFENPWQEELAEKLVKEFWTDARVFFCNSGTEANEAAIKLVRKFFRDKGEERYRIITFRNGFHGRTYGSLSATAQEKFHKGFEPVLEGFDYAELNDIDSVKKLLRKDTAAVMLEVIQGEGGVNECEPEFLKELQKLCREEGILLVVDEVQTGIGRTGEFYGYQLYGIEPDVITLAKGLGGGVPVGALIAREEVAGAFTPGSHGSTFGGNALACRAASVVVEEVKKLLPHAREVGEYLRKRLEGLGVGKVKGKGLILGIDYGKDCREVVMKALERGLVINCTAGSVIRLLPPLILEKEHVDEAITSLREVL
ncbi:acetylornithine aminotransferase/acetylornithine/N-succinyldiaminopimelate aminotransferase [Hydrogenivirga caldilitoris]|uniref:Acetylornithine aminotransferase n=1 Tax=Hydrogenivirga caldilitoris TaxID=246264 RepID=A0A497XNM6_9AQUI|nr:aspartate aminotransferase family protein [Hydrogenivirga caldilitoris]RLJ69861.1 acetylornithine aminotransferase/acetylornithine/N-succinyldiaminopimelate aminotransferase [Hydrogenivirga caldilitoris]